MRTCRRDSACVYTSNYNIPGKLKKQTVLDRVRVRSMVTMSEEEGILKYSFN